MSTPSTSLRASSERRFTHRPEGAVIGAAERVKFFKNLSHGILHGRYTKMIRKAQRKGKITYDHELFAMFGK